MIYFLNTFIDTQLTYHTHIIHALKYAIQGATLTTINLEIFPSPPKRNAALLSYHPHSPPLPALEHSHPRSVPIDLPTLGLSCKWHHVIRSTLRLASFTSCNVVTGHPRALLASQPGRLGFDLPSFFTSSGAICSSKHCVSHFPCVWE